MSLLREGMLVNGHVYSTGTGQVGSENAPKGFRDTREASQEGTR